MKKILFLLAVCLSLAACSKMKMDHTTFAASTSDGMLIIEFISDGDCLLYFEGGDSDDGYYHVKDNEISIIGSLTAKKSAYYHRYNFWSTNPGTIISADKFTYPVQYSTLSTDRTETLTFLKRN